MTKPHQDTEPFFITEEIAAEMIVAGYKFEPPPIACTMRLRDVLERMSDDVTCPQDLGTSRCRVCG